MDTAILGSELVVANSADSRDVERAAASLGDPASIFDFAACTVATDSPYA